MFFDPETLTLLREVLDGAWSRLLPDQQAQTSRAVLAERILKAAAEGERDPARLRTRALVHLMDSDDRLASLKSSGTGTPKDDTL